ncbi:OmpA family protein [Oceanobacillus longus]|uniref:OmpA family protein n=1 Tax=Oceanobacillus longus TaxID=930120 RepID=A0ABV8H2R3_9BACI
MKGILSMFKISSILVIFMLFFSACSNAEGNNNENDLPSEQATADEERITTDHNIEDVGSNSDKTEDIPKSEFFKSEMSIGSIFYKSSMEISSDFEKEIMETLTEFNAVGTADGAMLTLPEDILFDFDSDELRSEADKAMDQLTQVIETTDGEVIIVGHTDGRGDENYNQKLSERRAEAVKQGLIDAGVEKDRLKSEGKGASEPVASNTNSDGSDNPENRQKNRRVEVTIHGFN